MPAKRLVQGNEACAMGALAAGCRFFAGYPISPSSEIAEYMARQLPRVGGVFIQMEDEMASLGAVLGAALGGKKAMTATSGPGFSLRQENLGYASLAEIPCVVVDVMRVGPSTGVPTAPAQGDVMQARWGSHGDRAAIALAPASIAEVYELTIASFNLAERLRTSVILLYDGVIGHMREGVVLAEQAAADPWQRPFSGQEPGVGFQPYRPNDEGVAALPDFGAGYRFHVTGLMHDERGIQAGLFRPRALWPFPDAAVRAATRQARAVVVAEMNLGQWVYAVERSVARALPVIRCLKAGGELITEHELEEQVLPLFQGQQGVIV